MGVAKLDQNVAAMLRAKVNAAGQNDLRPALQMVMAAGALQPLPAAAVITLQPRGTQDFTLTSDPTGANGETTVKYRYDGPIQFASRRFSATVNRAGATVAAVTIDSGAFKGTALQKAAGVYIYPDNVQPITTPHDLKLTVTGGNPGGVVTLNFPGNRTLDQPAPVAGAIGLLESEAKDLAGKVLTHPMIGKPPTMFKWLRKWEWLKWGEVVEREELIRILLEFASTEPRLRALLVQNGISDPERALADIRQVAQHLEAEKPEAASHERLTQAILESARSSFVGRINNWFDQIMDRTTVEYKFRAQLVTVVAALFVASTVQLDSIDFLRRLSTDDKLRDSLVEQAKQQQARIDEQAQKTPDTQNQEELQRAKSLRDEIETNLAKLRDPQLGVLPDHFIWQPLPKARLMRNDEWNHPPKRLELVVGTSVFPIEPRWTSDLLADIEDAIRNSGAPVTLSRDRRKQYTVTSHLDDSDIDSLQFRIGTGDRAISGMGHTPSLAKTSLKDPGAANVPATDLFLVVGYYPPYRLHFDSPPDMASLAKALNESHASVSVQPIVKKPKGTVQDIILQATKPETRWIELLVRNEDPNSNVLKETVFFGGSATHDENLFENAHSCNAIIKGQVVAISPCTPDSASKVLTAHGFQMSNKWVDHLVLTSRRVGALQLCSVPGKSESNILNRAEEWSCNGPVCFDKDLFNQSWRGIVLTWILLSLGAPFWYDALKDLLKLRSSLAKKEEDARKDRQTTSPSPATATPVK